MKQHITVEDLQQLTDGQEQRLREWWKPQYGDKFVADDNEDDICCNFDDGLVRSVFTDRDDYPTLKMKTDCLPLLSIGQMMQLIRDHKEYDVHLNSLLWISEPAGALWYEVKKILSKPPEEVAVDDDDE